MTETEDTRIEHYAIIGNCRSSALVSRTGAVDWLCWPRFDSPPVFAALLDPLRGGSWTIRSTVPAPLRITRCYADGTAVLRTTFESDEASYVITEAMTLSTAADHARALYPENELIRVVTCLRGSVELEVHFDPRPDFGRAAVELIDRGKLGIRVEAHDGLLTFRSDVSMRIEHGHGAMGRVRLMEGESCYFSLTHTTDAPAVIPPLGTWTQRVLARTTEIWREWSARTQYDGPYRAEVVRSAIVVRLLAYAPSGAIVAAPTTSLPETVGGALNWDYRYCWLRDAAFTVRGMLELGHIDVARGFTGWLLHATRLTQPRLMILYDVFGRRPQPEQEVSHLRGYAGSLPVRVGNGADGQVQLDCYGEVIDAVWRVVCATGSLDRETASTLEAFALHVCAHWHEPDAGIWEPRGEARSHTHSIALCWVALDRVLSLVARGDMTTTHEDHFDEQRRRIRELLEERAYNHAIKSYTAQLDGDTLDATALLLGWYGYDSPSSERMQGTFAALKRELSPAPGLLYRYRSSKDDEGAFGICSFWLAEHLAQGGGTLAEARQSFEDTLAYANDLGLFAEEIDPRSGAALGNFPQTFTHVGLINAALSIQRREEQERQATSQTKKETPP